MSEKLSFRPKGDIAKRLNAIVDKSDGRITATDIQQAALEEYLAKLEKSGELSRPIQQSTVDRAGASHDTISDMFKRTDAQRRGKSARRKAS